MHAARTLRWARRRAGFTQRQLADKAGVPQSTIGRIEAGLVDPRLGTFDRLLRACDIVLEPELDWTGGGDRSLIQAQLAKPPRVRLEQASQLGREASVLRRAAQRAARAR